MTEYRRIENLRSWLSAPSRQDARARRKQRAEEGILDILNAVKQRYWPADDWTQDCLTKALKSLKAGQYDDALANARFALVPKREREPSYVPPAATRTVDDLKAELAVLKTRVIVLQDG